MKTRQVPPYLNTCFRNIVLIVELLTNLLLFLVSTLGLDHVSSILIFKEEEVAPADVFSRACVFSLLYLSHVFPIAMLRLCCSSCVCH